VQNTEPLQAHDLHDNNTVSGHRMSNFHCRKVRIQCSHHAYMHNTDTALAQLTSVGFAQARSTHNEPTFPPKFPMF